MTRHPYSVQSITFIVYAVILIFSFLIRVWGISEKSREIFSDEAINVTSARSLITTGFDLEGKRSFFFSDRLENRLPVYGYIAYLSTLIFGWNATAVRLPAVIGGVAVVAALIVLTKTISDTRTSILAGIFAAILPWLIHYARIGWEPSSFLPFALWGITLLILSGYRKNTAFLPAALTCLVCATYSYNSAIVPTIFLSGISLLLTGSFVKKNWRKYLLYVIAYLFCCLPLFHGLITEPKMTERALRISTFSQGIGKSSLLQFVHNYTAHFTASFLFFKGDPNARHGEGTGVLSIWLVPGILYCWITLIRKRQFALFFFLLLWLLYFPLGGSLTNDGVPHATRTLIGAPLFVLLSSIGTVDLYTKYISKQRYILQLSCIVLFLFFLTCSTAKYFALLYGEYPVKSAAAWESGNASVFALARQYENKTTWICLDNLNYWNAQSLLSFYNANDQYIEGTKDPRCEEENSILVMSYDPEKESSAQEITFDRYHNPQYMLLQNR